MCVHDRGATRCLRYKRTMPSLARGHEFRQGRSVPHAVQQAVRHHEQCVTRPPCQGPDRTGELSRAIASERNGWVSDILARAWIYDGKGRLVSRPGELGPNGAYAELAQPGD